MTPSFVGRRSSIKNCSGSQRGSSLRMKPSEKQASLRPSGNRTLIATLPDQQPIAPQTATLLAAIAQVREQVSDTFHRRALDGCMRWGI